MTWKKNCSYFTSFSWGRSNTTEKKQPFSLALSRILICLLLTLTFTYQSKAEDSSNGPFPIVEVDLNAGIFKEVLPFDVPFIITGQVTKDTKEVKLAYYESGSVISDQDIPPDAWQSVNSWYRFIGLEGDKFSILVPPLRVNRYFRFRFSFERSVADKEVEAFRRRASDAVDELLRNFGEVSNLNVDQSNKLRIQLILAVKTALGPGIDMDVEPGTIFDENANSSSVRNTFNQKLAEILDAQNNRYDGISNFAGKVPSAADYLNELIGNTIFARIVDELKARASQDESIDTLLQANIDALDIRRLSQGDVVDLVAGLKPGSPPANLYAVWDAYLLDDQISQLQGTMRTLNRLNRFVSHIRSTSSLSRAVVVTVDELNSLTELISRSVEDFQEIQRELAFIKESLEMRKEAIDAYISQLGNQVRDDITVYGSSVGDFNTRHSWYISADVGLAWATDIDEVFSYFGTNIYFRPVNKNAPLKGLQFFRRFSIMIGLTLQDLEMAGQRESTVGSQMLVIGGGLRLTSSMRVSGGAIVFKKPDPNPLISDTELALSPFISLSFDWNVASTLGDLGRAFGITK